MPRLSRPLPARLAAVYRQTLPGVTAADIGTGHALLAIALRESGRVPRVVATESVPAPLTEAAKNLEAAGVTGLELRLGWGLDPVAPGEVGQICIAGMGAETICRILERGSRVALQVARLTLQPQNHPERVRTWLLDHQFGLVAEDLVEERGHFYPVLAASSGAGWDEREADRCLRELPRSWVSRLGPLLLSECHPVLLRQVERLIAERKTLLARFERAVSQRSRLSRDKLAREALELELIREWLHRSPQ